MVEQRAGFTQTIADKTWKLFASVKLAVALLIVLALVSIVGTVIQQNEPPERYLQEYSPATVRLFEALGFFDMYHTWWFVFLLLLLTANLTVCTFERFPQAWSTMKTPLKPLDDDTARSLLFSKDITVESGITEAEARATKVLASRRYRHTDSREAGTVQIMSQKGAYSRMGVYLTHLSIILIFVGALIGVFFGFKAYLSLPEGAVRKFVYLRNEPLWDRVMSSVGIAERRVQWSPEAGMPVMPIGFYIQCDDFDVDYYVNAAGMPTGMPSEYQSTLSIFDLQGKKILTKRIRVNDPLTYDGITFYQSSYGTIPDAPGKAVLNIRRKNSSGAGEQAVIDLGESLYVPSIDRTIKLLGFAPFGIRDRATGKVQLYHSRQDEYINPAVQLEVYKGKRALYKTELLKTDQGTPNMPEDYIIRLERYAGTRYTGLQATKDPGVWVVYAGFILLCIGPLVAFFESHKKLWIRIRERNGSCMITVAGTVNKNRPGFEREFNSIVEELVK